MIYYVYILFDWRGTPRYVGKGKGERWTDHELETSPHNPLKNEFIEQTWIMLEEIPKVKVAEGLSEKEAFKIEIALILAIGRIDLGTGPLVNLTEGGEGARDHAQRAGLRTVALKSGIHGLTREQLSENGRKGGTIGGKRAAERKTGVHGRSPEKHAEDSRKGGRIGGRRTTDQGKSGFQLMPRERRVELGQMTYDAKVGLHGMTTKELSAAGHKGGSRTVELGVGIHGLSTEQRADNSHRQAANMIFQKATCPHCNKTGSITNMVRWHFDRCPKRRIGFIRGN